MPMAILESSNRPIERISMLREQTNVSKTEQREPGDSDTHLASITHVLAQSFVFQHVARELLSTIASITTPRLLAKGQYLFYEGAAAQGFYIVRRGAIKLHRIYFAGQERIVRVCRSLESFGEEVLFSASGYALNASATEETHLLMIRKNEFIALLKREPDLVLNVLRSMNQQFENLVALLDDLTRKDVTTRLVGWLLQHCPDPTSCEPYTVRLPGPKRQLAAELGTVSETFSRTLAKFRDQNLVSIDRNAVTLISPNRLAKLLHAHNADVPSVHQPIFQGALAEPMVA